MLIDDREATLERTLRQWCEERIDALPDRALPAASALEAWRASHDRMFMDSLRPHPWKQPARMHSLHHAAVRAAREWPYAQAFKWRHSRQVAPFNAIGLIGRTALDVMRRDVWEPRTNIRAEWAQGYGFQTSLEMRRWTLKRALDRVSGTAPYGAGPAAQSATPGRLQPGPSDPFWLQSDQMMPPEMRGEHGSIESAREWAAASRNNIDEATRSLQTAVEHAESAARSQRRRAGEFRRAARSIAREAQWAIHRIAMWRPSTRRRRVYFRVATPVVGSLLQGAGAACEDAMSTRTPGRCLGDRLQTAADCTALAALVLGTIAAPDSGRILRDDVSWEIRAAARWHN